MEIFIQCLAYKKNDENLMTRIISLYPQHLAHFLLEKAIDKKTFSYSAPHLKKKRIFLCKNIVRKLK